jgi:hypothetical protein
MMADNRKKRGKRDRARVSNQSFELEYMMRKFKVSRQQVSGAKRAVGNSRAKVEQYLRQRAG